MTNQSSGSNTELHTYPAVGARMASDKQMRCDKCNKMLAKSNGTGALAAEIKCPRCGCMNES